MAVAGLDQHVIDNRIRISATMSDREQGRNLDKRSDDVVGGDSLNPLIATDHGSVADTVAPAAVPRSLVTLETPRERALNVMYLDLCVQLAGGTEDNLLPLHWGFWPTSVTAPITDSKMYDAVCAFSENLLAYIPEGVSHVLDVGCGLGFNEKLLASRHIRVTAVSPIAHHCQTIEKAELPGVEVRCARFEGMPCEARYDLLLFSESVNHFSLDEMFWKHCAGFLDGSGFLLMADDLSEERARLIETQRVFRVLRSADITENVAPTSGWWAQQGRMLAAYQRTLMSVLDLYDRELPARIREVLDAVNNHDLRSLFSGERDPLVLKGRYKIYLLQREATPLARCSVGEPAGTLTADRTPPIVYVHANGQPLQLTVATGVLANLNALPLPKLGLYQFEMDDDVVRSARVICLSLHWYASMAALLPYCGYLKSVNPEVVIVVGGLTANVFAAILLSGGAIDYVMTGDTEEAFRTLVEGILAGRSEDELASLPNVWSRRGAPRLHIAHDDASYARLNWLDHDWFPSFGLWTRWVHESMRREDCGPDHCFPNLPLMRGCRYLCPGCYGDYQRTLFGRPTVALSQQRLLGELDQIEAAGYRFVSLSNGVDILGFLHDGPFERRYDLEVHVPICFLPTTAELEHLCDSFRFCRLHITYPEDDLLLNRLQRHADDHFVDRFYDTFASLKRDNLEVTVNRIAEWDDHKRELEDRLAREPIAIVRLLRQYDWIRPVPDPMAAGEADFARFHLWSSEFQNYLVASSLFPAGEPVFTAWDPLRSYDAPAVEAVGEWALLQEALRRRYQQRALPGVAEVQLCCHAPGGGTANPQATPRWCPSAEAAGLLSTATLRFDGHRPHFALRCSELAGARELVLVPRLRLEAAQDSWLCGSTGIRLCLPSIDERADTLDVAVVPGRLLVRLLGTGQQPLWAEEMPLENGLMWLHSMITPQTLADALAVALDGVACAPGALAGWRVTRAAAPCSIAIEPPVGTGKVRIVPRAIRTPGIPTRLFEVRSEGPVQPEVLGVVAESLRSWEESVLARHDGGGSGGAVKARSSAPEPGAKDARREPGESDLAAFLSGFFGESATPIRLDSDWSITAAHARRSEPLNHVVLTCQGRRGQLDVRVEPICRDARFFVRTLYLAISYLGEPPAWEDLVRLMTHLELRIRRAERELTPDQVPGIYGALA